MAACGLMRREHHGRNEVGVRIVWTLVVVGVALLTAGCGAGALQDIPGRPVAQLQPVGVRSAPSDADRARARAHLETLIAEVKRLVSAGVLVVEEGERFLAPLEAAKQALGGSTDADFHTAAAHLDTALQRMLVRVCAPTDAQVLADLIGSTQRLVTFLRDGRGVL